MSTSEDTEQTESIGAKVTPELKRKIRIEAAKHDMTMSQFIRERLEEAIEDSEEN